MDWRLALVMLGAIPVFAGLFRLLTGALPPLAGYALALALSWVLIGGLALAVMSRGAVVAALRWRSPGRGILWLCLLAVVVTGAAAMLALGRAPLPAWLVLPVAAAALVNGTVEELFWRGALLPAPDREGVVTAWALFVAWHVAPLVSLGIVLPGGAVGLIGGAAVLGAILMAARLRSGTVGAGVLTHVSVNMFAFAQVAAQNWTAS